MVTIAAPSDPTHVVGLFRDHVPEIEAGARPRCCSPGARSGSSASSCSTPRSTSLAAKVARLQQALLILHSPRDTTVDIGNATRIFTAAKHPKSFVSLDHADHLLSAKRDAIYAANVIAAWSEPYVNSAIATPRPMKCTVLAGPVSLMNCPGSNTA